MRHIGPYPLNSIITGDARELAAAIPDESVDLVLTDPPWRGFVGRNCRNLGVIDAKD